MRTSFSTNTIFYFLCIVSICTSLISRPAVIKEEWLNWVGCIDYHIASNILEKRPQIDSNNERNRVLATGSIDLGRSTEEISLTSEGLCRMNEGQDVLLATWDELEMIAKKRNGCYSLFDDGSKPYHITALGKTTGIPASLMPPLEDTGAPTMVRKHTVLLYTY